MSHELHLLYAEIKDTIKERISKFRLIWETGDDLSLFKEFVFCLLTPQSKAKTCWNAVERLTKDGTIKDGSKVDIEMHLKGVRFKKNKSQYIIEARRQFFKNGKFLVRKYIATNKDPKSIREWLVENVKGYGYKEASHFLRNIGLGRELAILDRHILRNLKRYGVIEEIPKALSRKSYLEIENRMREFSREIGIPLEELDLLLWYKETGEVFK